MTKLLIALVIGVIIIGAALMYGTPGSSTPPTTTTTTDTTTSGTTGSSRAQADTITTKTTTTGTVTTGKATSPTVTTSATVVVSQTMAIVTGKITPNGSPTTYWYDYDTTDALGLHTTKQTIGSGYASLAAPAAITPISPNTKYQYRLNAENAYGTITGEVFSFTSNTSPSPVVVRPDLHSVSASALARTSATLNGELTTNGPPTSYWFEYGVTKDMGNTTPVQSTGASAKITVSASVTNLKPYTDYYFRLNAQNQYGTRNGEVTTFRTSGPSAP